MKLLTIGQIGKRAGVGIETLRYYEREGLLAEPGRTQSGYRQYGEDVISRLHFIKRAKELGFSLREIGDLLSLRVDCTTTCETVRERAKAKIADIEERIEALQKMKAALVKVTKQCRGQGPTSECPILDALDRETEVQ